MKQLDTTYVMNEDDKTALRAEIFRIIERQQEERRMESRARRQLRKRAMILHKRNYHFTVADHLGGVPGAPFRASIHDVLNWIEGLERKQPDA